MKGVRQTGGKGEGRAQYDEIDTKSNKTMFMRWKEEEGGTSIEYLCSFYGYTVKRRHRLPHNLTDILHFKRIENHKIVDAILKYYMELIITIV